MQIDILQSIRIVESANDYKAIGNIINTYKNGKPRGLALGIWQSIPDTIESLMTDKEKAEYKYLTDLLNASRATTTKHFTRHNKIHQDETLSMSERVAQFKATWSSKLTQAYPTGLQDKLQIRYMLDMVKDLDDNHMVDWRSLILCNHQGYLIDNSFWDQSEKLNESLTKSNKYINETAYGYIAKSGNDPLSPGLVSVKDIRAYLNSYTPGSSLDITNNIVRVSISDNINNISSNIDKALGFDEERAGLARHVNINPENGDTVIGDQKLVIPPSSLHMYQQNQVYTVDAVRMTGNPKLLNNIPVISVDMSVYFNGQNAINTQLRPLVAQFKQTPFTTMRNATVYRFLSDVLRKNGVADSENIDYVDANEPIPIILQSITINTIPGFPELIQANITVSVFNHLPYVSDLQFWTKSEDSVKNALYSIYRNSLLFKQQKIEPDAYMEVLDAYGNRIKVDAPALTPDSVSSNPEESYPYVKTYSALLEESPYKSSTGSTNKMTRFNNDSSLRLKYFSNKYVNNQERHYYSIRNRMQKALGDISQLLAFADMGQYDKLDKVLKLDFSYQFEKFSQDVTNLIRVYNDLYDKGKQFFHKMFERIESQKTLWDNKIYVTVNDLGRNMTPTAAWELFTKSFKAATDQEKKDKIKNLMVEFSTRLLMELAKKDEKQTSRFYIPTIMEFLPDTSKASENHNVGNKYQTFDDTYITSLSFSYSNKFTPIPVHGYTLPSFQHLGHGEWSIGINIKTRDESVITYLEDVQSASASIIRERVSKRLIADNVNHRLTIMNQNNLFRALGISSMVMKSFDAATVEEAPGWFTVNADLVQDDAELLDSSSLRLLDQVSVSLVEKLAKALFPFQNEKDEILKQLVSKIPDAVWSSYRDIPKVITTIVRNIDDTAVTEKITVNKDMSELFAVSSYDLIWKDALESGEIYVPQSWDVPDPNFIGPTEYYNPTNRKTATSPYALSMVEPYKEYFKARLPQSLQVPVVRFYDASNNENTILTNLVNNELFPKFIDVYLSIMAGMAIEDRPPNELQDIIGSYTQYTDMICDYFVSMSTMDAGVLNRYLAALRGRKGSTTGRLFDPWNKLLLEKRMQLTKYLMLKPIFSKLSTLIPDRPTAEVVLEVDSKIKKLQKHNAATLLDNYPDFEFPQITAGLNNTKIMGPAFPYASTPQDEILRHRYQQAEDYVERATMMMAAVTGSATAEELEQEAEEFKAFMTTFNQRGPHEGFTQVGLNNVKVDGQTIIDRLKSLEQIKLNKEFKTGRTAIGRNDLMDMIRARSIANWYAVNKALGLNDGYMITGLDFGVPDTVYEGVDSDGKALTEPDYNIPAPKDGIEATVLSVTDGDTIVVRRDDGEEKTIRFIDLNTNESTTGQVLEKWGPEAKAALKRMLPVGSKITLVSQQTTGKYERTLSYVFYNGQLLNMRMLAEGYGTFNDYGNDSTYSAEMKKAWQYAVFKQKGMHQDKLVTRDATPVDPENIIIDVQYKDANGKLFKNSLSLENYLSNYVYGNKKFNNSAGGNSDINKVIQESGFQTKEHFINYIQQAYTEMIQTCNAEDPDQFTKFMGFTDTDSAEKRREVDQQLVNTKSRGYENSMYRAFPTVKIFFRKEDNVSWNLFDDYYNYAAIISVDVVDSKHAASQTAIVKLNNMFDKLASNAALTNLSDADSPYDVSGMMLKVGAQILIKMGYGPDISTLPTVFTGAVTQIQPGEIMEITAQSWGVELTNPVKTSQAGMSFSGSSPERSMGAAALRILGSTNGLHHFGRWSPGQVNNGSTKVSSSMEERLFWMSTLAPAFDFLGGWLARKSDSNAVDTFTKGVRSVLDHRGRGLVDWGNPLYDNIYLTNIKNSNLSLAKYATANLTNWLSNDTEFTWKIFNQSIWDALWEMALFQGDFIVRPLPYNEHSLDPLLPPRSTLYFGPRNGLYKAVDDIKTTGEEYRKLSPEVVKQLLFTPGTNTPADYKPQVPMDKFKKHVSSIFLARWTAAKNSKTSSFWYVVKPILKNILTGGGVTTFNEHFAERDWAYIAKAFHDMQESGFNALIPEIISALTIPRDGYEEAYKYTKLANAGNMASFLSNPKSYLATVLKLPGLFTTEYSSTKTSEYQTSLIKSKAEAYDIPESVSAYLLAADQLSGVIITESIWKLVRFAYNYEDILARDLANIIYDTSTLNAQGEMYDKENIRQRLINDEMFDYIFDVSRMRNSGNDYMYRPIVEHHFINSYKDILTNNIVATADSMFNRVELTFPTEPTFETARNMAEQDKLKHYTVDLNPHIDPDYIRTYSTYQKNLRYDWIMDWMDSRSWGDDFDENYNVYHSRNAMPAFTNIGNQILANVVKPMYQGNLTIIGNSNIRPWHIVHLYDEVNQMWGPFEVEQVVHSFNAQSGFTTTITPNAVVYNRDLESVWDTQYLSAFGSIDMYYQGVKSAKSILLGTLAGITGWKFRSAFSGLSALKLGGVSGSTIAKGGGIAAAAAFLANIGISFAKTHYEGAVARAGKLAGWMPLIVVPMMYRGAPYLAGMERAYWAGNIHTFILGELENSMNTLEPGVLPGYVLPLKEF